MPERRHWVEIALMPLVIALIGTIGTWLVTRQQERSAQQRANSDRQVKVLEIFAEKITSPDDRQRLLALRMLRAVDAELASDLALAVAETEPEESAVRDVATAVATESGARAGHSPQVYVHVPDEASRRGARRAAERLEEAGFAVPGIENVGDRSPAATQLRYFRKREEAIARTVAGELRKARHPVRVVYIAGYERSGRIDPLHFELWFGQEAGSRRRPAEPAQ
jgi:hypothetical protein